MAPKTKVKYGKLTLNQIGALVNRVGGMAGVEDVLSHRKRVVLEDVIRLLFDKNGRGIPFPEMEGGVVDQRPSLTLAKPGLDYLGRHARLQEFYGKDARFVSAAEFEDRCGAAIKRMADNSETENLLKGPYFPFVMPQLRGDLGTLLDDTMVPAMERSYLAQFPGRKLLYKQNVGALAGGVEVVAGTRQERLVEAMNQGPVVGIYFPCLRGFSVVADAEFMAVSPETLILAGMEVPVIVTAYPEMVGGCYDTPCLDMASLRLRGSEQSICFWAGHTEAHMERRILPEEGDAECWGGITFLA